MLLRNLILITLVAGSMHLFLYTLQKQGKLRKFDGRPLVAKSKSFTFGSQVRDNIFWSCASGVPIWTAFEVAYVWALGNGYLPTTSFTGNPVWFVACFVLIPIWSSAHFYWIHRAIHWPPLYKWVHSLHHRNVNIGPWSGISMHPAGACDLLLLGADPLRCRLASGPLLLPHAPASPQSLGLAFGLRRPDSQGQEAPRTRRLLSPAAPSLFRVQLRHRRNALGQMVRVLPRRQRRTPSSASAPASPSGSRRPAKARTGKT